MSNATADHLELKDDSALWGAIARHGAQSCEPVLVELPTFGGGGSVEAITPESSIRPLGSHAADRAKAFNPYEDDDVGGDEEDVYVPEDAVSFWRDRETHYRWFLRERAADIRWLDGLRSVFSRDLASASVDNQDIQAHSTLKVERRGGSAVLRNQGGGRLGKLQRAVRVPRGSKSSRPDSSDVEVLVLATEFDRPAAIEAFASVGIHLPFDPTPGWLNASVEPGRHGWLVVVWRGAISGLFFEPVLAQYHIDSRELTVFEAALRKPVELLLRRAGFLPQQVLVENHPDDPERFFGIDLTTMTKLMELAPAAPWIIGSTSLPKTETPPRSRHGEFEFETARLRARQRPHRKLRSTARELLPAEWAQQIDAVWWPSDAPGAPAGPIRPGDALSAAPGHTTLTTVTPFIAPNTQATRFGTVPCRLCDGTTHESDQESYPYCSDCCSDAREGLFFDRGFDEGWRGAVIWSLKMLAEIEFGGPPAKEQLAQLPAVGPQSDLLMLCRMLTARSYATVLGSTRKGYAWTDWLAHADLLTGGFRRSRGVTVIAKDGHICRSLLERQIDDFFYDHGIEHEVEPHYPFDSELNVSGYRADWKLPDGTYVEALGFPNDPAYMAKAQRKIKLAEQHQIPVLTITRSDIADLASVFIKWLPRENARPIDGELSPGPVHSAKASAAADPNSNSQPWR
ncbi:hypothetical protein [Mycobacterium sp.]|uniref:hypothetical protein n=1 Tax=Mycobacterium sp. TaxID=1785 RepID=UPI00257A7BF8|nr:hypothetical protein [Mycobacterium sp.]